MGRSIVVAVVFSAFWALISFGHGSAESSVSNPCEADGYGPRKIGVSPVSSPRPVTICLQKSAILPLLFLAMFVAMQLENIRWCAKILCRKKTRADFEKYQELPTMDSNADGSKRKRTKQKMVTKENVWLQHWVSWARAPVLMLASIYPIFYNHDMMFLYVNDKFYRLLGVQLGFTLSDDMCLLLRWIDVMPGARLGLRILHVYFNLALEGNRFSPRNLLFLVDDTISLIDLILIERYAQSRHLWSRRQLLYAVVAPIASIIMSSGLASYWSVKQDLT